MQSCARGLSATLFFVFFPSFLQYFLVCLGHRQRRIHRRSRMTQKPVPHGFERWRRRCEEAMLPKVGQCSTQRSTHEPGRPFGRPRINMEHQRFLYSTVGEGGQREAPSQFAWTRRWLGLGSVSEKAVEKQEEGIDEDGSVIDVIQKILDAGNSNEVESGADRDDRLRCESYLHNLLRKSPMVRFMIKHLILVGCSPMDEDGNVGKIMIRKCPPTMAGGFASAAKPKQSGLLLCQNTIQSQKHMEATISHEMIHWFDHCRFKVDWQDWRHVACSEIRAANLSGDCRFWHEVFDRRQFGFRKQHQNCVRRRAVDSMVMSEDGPKVRETAEKVVDEVWASCFNDTRPFDEVY